MKSRLREAHLELKGDCSEYGIVWFNTPIKEFEKDITNNSCIKNGIHVDNNYAYKWLVSNGYEDQINKELIK